MNNNPAPVTTSDAERAALPKAKRVSAIGRYVAMEKRVGRSGDSVRACRIAMHVYRACRLYGYTFNPYG